MPSHPTDRRASESHAYKAPQGEENEPRHANHHGFGMRHYEKGDPKLKQSGSHHGSHKKKSHPAGSPGGRRSLVRHLSGSFQNLFATKKRRHSTAVVLSVKKKNHMYEENSSSNSNQGSGTSSTVKKHAVAHWGKTQLKPPDGYDVRDPTAKAVSEETPKTAKELALEKLKAKKSGKSAKTKIGKAAGQVVKSISSKFQKTREVSKQEQKQNNIRTMGSLIVTSAIIGGVIAAL